MLVPSIFGDHLLNGFFEDFDIPNNLTTSKMPASNFMKTDVKEHEKAYELDIELPGYKKEDVSAMLKDGYLTVSAKAETTNDQTTDSGKYLRRERYSGSCSRSFYVGKDVTQEDIQARFEQGILIIDIPKIEKKPEIENTHYITIAG